MNAASECKNKAHPALSNAISKDFLSFSLSSAMASSSRDSSCLLRASTPSEPQDFSVHQMINVKKHFFFNSAISSLNFSPRSLAVSNLRLHTLMSAKASTPLVQQQFQPLSLRSPREALAPTSSCSMLRPLEAAALSAAPLPQPTSMPPPVMNMKTKLQSQPPPAVASAPVLCTQPAAPHINSISLHLISYISSFSSHFNSFQFISSL